MSAALTYRLARPEDSPALQAIIEATPDAGLIGFANDYRADLLAVSQALAHDLQGAVAERDGAIVGMILGDFVQVQWAGELRRAVYISHLRVHPDFQRQGVGRGLADWAFDYVRERLGPNALLYSAVMQGNASLILAQQYQFQVTDAIQGGIVPMCGSAPKPQTGLKVRLATQADLPAIAQGVNDFYRDHDLWSPVDPATLADFSAREVAGVRPNQLYVVSRGAQILGGLSLSDRTELVRIRIARAPAYVRLLGAVLGVLPRSGILRALTARRVWFAPGELEAGRYLWRQLRYQLRQRGNCLGIAYDPGDRLAELFQIPFWLPMFKACYAVRVTEPLVAKRRVYCVAGP